MACKELRAAFPDKVILAGTDGYVDLVESYFSISARQSPQCFVNPTSADDVALAVRILKKFPDTSFAIKSGGHSTHPDIAGTDDGIVINLYKLNSIAQSTENDTIYELGVGGTWGDFYELLTKERRSASGSRNAAVGVGGFLMGGGLSFFSPERGFACDDVVNMQVVLASGDIVNTNRNSYPDLFRALKGSHSNLGIVTRIDIKSHPRDKIWGGAIAYPLETEADQLKTFCELKNAEIHDQHAQVELSFVYYPAMGGVFVSNNHWYSKDVSAPSALKCFQDIQPQMNNTMRLDTTLGFTQELTKINPKNKHAYFATTTFVLKPHVLAGINNIWHAHRNALQAVHNLVFSITYQQCPPPPSNDAPNALGFTDSSRPGDMLIIFIVAIYWDQKSDSDSIAETARAFVSGIEKFTRGEDVYHPFKYINYAAPWQPVLESYGTEAHEALKKASGKYDPEGFFQKQAIGFKL